MKKMFLLIATGFCLSFTQHSAIPALKPQPEPALKAAASKPLSFPTDVNWSIGYNWDLPLLTLTWPRYGNSALGPVPISFMGSSQYVNPASITSIYWAGFTLTPNANYTMNIAGVNYYFYWPGVGFSQCIITGHS